MKLLLSFLFFAFSCSSFKKNVIIYPQWHLSSSTLTNKVEESSKLVQFENQKFIFLDLKNQIFSNKVDVILSEGCEGEIDDKFEQSFNGWNYRALDGQKNSSIYDNILTLVPLKLEVEFKEKILTLCADNNALIKKQLLSFSDLRAYVGYYHRLVEFKNNPKKYQLYADGLLNNGVNDKNLNATDYAKAKAQDSLNLFLKSIEDRNQVVVSHIESHKEKNIALVIGQLHLNGLEQMLMDRKINYTVVPVKGLPDTNPWTEVDALKNILK